MASKSRAVAPETRKGRTVAVRPLTTCAPSGVISNITDRLRTQYLTDRAGLGAQRAQLIAGLAWGGAHD